MSSRHRLAIATIAFICSYALAAETVYKSVDAEGKVTYSASPPPDPGEQMVEEVEIAPGPTEEQRQEAARRAKELQSATRRSEQERKEKAAANARSLSVAEQDLRNAEIALQEARVKTEDDWQTLATGGRVLKQSYIDRVADAERKVREAKKAVRSARSGKL